MAYDGIATDFTPVALAPAYVPVTAEVFWAGTPQQKRIYLAELLEHEDKLPLRWDFENVESQCGTAGCALGSARALWVRNLHSMPIGAWDFSERGWDDLGIADVFGWDAARLYGLPFDEVTPGMVAKKLREYRP